VPSTKQWAETKAERKARKLKARLEKEAEAIATPLPDPAPPVIKEDRLYIACLKWGEKYSAEYVNRLASMVRRNCTYKHTFICFTENKKGLDSDIEVRPLPRMTVQGWWYKPMMLGDELGISGTLLFLDLDLIVFRNIDKLWDFNPDGFSIIRDFNRNMRPNWDRMNSSVFKTPIGRYQNLWSQFVQNPKLHTAKNRGDQDWMFRHIRDHKFWPDPWIMSYKWEMRDRRDLKLVDGVRNFALDAPPKINDHTSIAVFHGDPNPAVANDSWVKKHWG